MPGPFIGAAARKPGVHGSRFGANSPRFQSLGGVALGNALRALGATALVLGPRACSAVVGGDCPRATVEANSSAVRQDPLWAGVTEGHTDADYGPYPVEWTPHKRECLLWQGHVGTSPLSTKTRP